MEKVLEGVRILDCARWAATPYGATLLADMGAEVIRVERPGGEEDRGLGPFTPDGTSIMYISIGRNKKGITLDLHSQKGKEIFKQLLKQSDVVFHNFVPGTREAKDFEYEALKEVNPRIIVVAGSGYGQYGPYAKRYCFDSVAQAVSGAMSYTGFPGNPPTRSAVAWVDFSTATHAALGAMFALYYREKTGVGQMIDISLVDTAVSFVASQAVPADYKLWGVVREQFGNHSYYNFSDCLKVKDGWVMLSVIGNYLWRRFTKMIGREELADDPRLSDNMSRFKNRDLFEPLVREWMEQRTADEVIRLLEEARVPCARVLTIPELLDDPHIKAREMIAEVDYPGAGKIPIGTSPIKLSETPAKIESIAPRVGEHNEEIYSALLGFSREELSKLKEEGVI